MTSRVRAGFAVLVLMATAWAGVGCSSDEETKPAPSGLGGSGGTAGSGADGGEDGSALGGAGGTAGGSGASGSSGASGHAGTDGGEDAESDGGDEADAAEEAAASPCQANVAFWAVGMSFKYPTPQDLGLALNSLTYDPELHPITIALEAVKAPIFAKGAASATEDNGAYSQVFPSGKEPEPVDITLQNEAFTSVGKQNLGYLRVKDENGLVYIKLTALEFSATTQSGCSMASVSLNGRIPSDQAGVTLKIGGVSKTLEQIAGAPGDADAGSDGWALSATFQGEATKFDFGSFPTQ